jgi:putative membrane protein
MPEEIEGKSIGPNSALGGSLDNTRMAHERTLLAWVRTSTSLITFGFTLYKLFQTLDETGVRPAAHHFLSSRRLGMSMILIAIIGLGLAIYQYWSEMSKLRKIKPDLAFSIAWVTAIPIFLLGLFFFLAAAFRQ